MLQWGEIGLLCFTFRISVSTKIFNLAALTVAFDLHFENQLDPESGGPQFSEFACSTCIKHSSAVYNQLSMDA